jgi:predicted Zn-dependent protease
MRINRIRLAITLAVLMTLVVGGGGLYAWSSSKSAQVGRLTAAVTRLIEAKNFEAARIEADKLVLLQPGSAKARLLKGLAYLGERDPASITLKDREGLEAMAGFAYAARIDPTLIDAQEKLLRFYLSAGDVREAEPHAREVLKVRADDLEAIYAVAASKTLDSPDPDGIRELVRLLDREKPTRARTAWLAVRVGQNSREGEPLRQRMDELLQTVDRTPPKVVDRQDRLGVCELTAWRARRETEPAAVRAGLEEAMKGLHALLAEENWSDRTPKLVSQAATRLIPEEATWSDALRPVFTDFRGRVEKLHDEAFERTVAGGVLDPQIYIEHANRCRQRGQLDRAVDAVTKGIALAKNTGPEARRLFGVCDFWLAQHYLAANEADKAAPHIEALITNEQYKPAGQLLAGMRHLQRQEWDDAAKVLSQASAKLQDNGLAKALYGMAQLRRGYVSEGRMNLEEGIRKGVSDPRYKAWLAIALADSGYQEQALAAAREALAGGERVNLGHQLIGHLEMRAGRHDEARKHFALALQNADAVSKPKIQLLMAELAVTRREFDQADALFAELRQVESVAPAAAGLEFRSLVDRKRIDDAEALLAAARKKFPDHYPLLELEVNRLLERKEGPAAVKLVQAEIARQPKSTRAALLIGEIHDRLNQPAEAIATLREAIRRLPDESALKVRLTERLLFAKKFDEAGPLLADLRGNPLVNQGQVDALVAQAEFLKGNVAEADRLIEQAYKKDPDNSGLKLLYGQLLARRQKFDEATTVLETAFGGGPFNRQAFPLLFDALLRKGDVGRARELLKLAPSKGVSVSVFRERLLRLLARKESWPELQAELANMVRENPTEESCAFGVALLRYMGELEKAKQALELARQSFKDSPLLEEHRLAMALEEKRFDIVDSGVEAALKKDPAAATFHVLKVYSMLERARLPEADAAAAAGWAACPGNAALCALKVQTLVRTNRAAEALEFAKKAASANAELPNANYIVARVWESLGHRDRAMAMMATAVGENPSDVNVAHHYLRMRISEGQTADLKETLDRLLAANPDNAMLLGVLVEYHAQRGELDAARLAMAKLERTNASIAVRAYSEAVILIARRDFVSAEKKLRIAMGDPRGHLPSQFLLARVFAAQGRFPDALEVANQTARQQPGSAVAQSMRAEFLYRLGKPEEAEAVCREYLKGFPKSRPFRMQLMQILSDRGEPSAQDEAVRIAEAVYDESRSAPADFERCARVLARFGREKRLIDTLGSLARNEGELFAAGCRALIGSGKADRAASLLERRAESGVLPVDLRFLQAEALMTMAAPNRDRQLYTRAAETYRAVLKEDSANLTAANNLAWVEGEYLGRPGPALEEFFNLFPNLRKPQATLPAELIDTIGALHWRARRLDEAQAWLETGASASPNSAAIQYHLGLVYRDLKREDRAKVCFRRVMEGAPTSKYAAEIQAQRLMAD